MRRTIEAVYAQNTRAFLNQLVLRGWVREQVGRCALGHASGASAGDLPRYTFARSGSFIAEHGLRAVVGASGRSGRGPIIAIDRLEYRKLLWHAGQAGKGYVRNVATCLMRRPGRERGEGPFASMMQDPDIGWGRNGQPNAGYLVGPGGDAARDGNLEGLVVLLRHNGFGDAWEEFLRWDHAYSTLSFDDSEARFSEFPSRPEKRNLADETWVHRVITPSLAAQSAAGHRPPARLPTSPRRGSPRARGVGPNAIGPPSVRPHVGATPCRWY